MRLRPKIMVAEGLKAPESSCPLAWLREICLGVPGASCKRSGASRSCEPDDPSKIIYIFWLSAFRFWICIVHGRTSVPRLAVIRRSGWKRPSTLGKHTSCKAVRRCSTRTRCSKGAICALMRFWACGSHCRNGRPPQGLGPCTAA